MYERLLKNNITYLNKNLTKGLFEIKNIYLTDEEAILVTSLIKGNLNDLLKFNYQNTFNILAQSVKKETYESILSLYLTTIKKYF